MIGDFGLSQVQDQVSSSFNVTRTSSDKIVGTFRWMAPEVMQGKGLNKPVDVYGFALVAWELYTRGAIPMGSITDVNLFCALVIKGERSQRPTEIGDEMWRLVQNCWTPDPWERPNFVGVGSMLASLKLQKGNILTIRPDVA